MRREWHQFRDPGFAAIERRKRGIDRATHFTPRARANPVAFVPCVLDHGLKLVSHSSPRGSIPANRRRP